MRARRHTAAAIVFALLLVQLAVCLQAEENVIEVAPGDSIQSALRRADESTIIRLLPGIHRENLRIDRSVRLIGDPDHPEAVILESRMAGPVVMITGLDAEQQISIEGLTIRGASGYLPDGILYTASSFVRCYGLIIEDCQGNGITAAGNGTLSIQDCLIRDNGRFGIDVQTEMTTMEVSGNRLYGNGADLGGFANPGYRTPLAPQTSSLTIQVPEQYGSLQEAVDAAPDGATILVAKGEFETGVTLWKNVSIIGRGQAETILTPAGQGTVTLSILSMAHTVVLQDLKLMVAERNPIVTYGLLSLKDVAVIGQHTVNQDPIFKVGAGGTIDARNSRFEQVGGVAIQALPGSSVTIADCSFSGNNRDVVIIEASNVTIANTRFEDTRQQAIEIFDSLFLVENCVFEECMDSLVATGSMGTILNTESNGAARNGIGLYGGANVSLEACTLSGSGNYNLLIEGDAIAALSECTLGQAEYAGLVAIDTSSFTISDSRFVGNLGAGVIIAGQARGEIASTIIQGNGGEPTPSDARNKLPGGGIVASMNSHLTLRSVDILQNSQGILIDSVNPLYDEMISLTAPREIVSLTPIVGMYDCRVEGNLTTGIVMRSRGELRMVDCSIAMNAEVGIWLDGAAYVLTKESADGRSYNFVYQDVEGIEVFLDGCTIENNVWAGVWLEGLAAAEISHSDIFENSCGIGMDVTARLRLEGNRILDNVSYGILFAAHDCDAFTEDCVPEAGRLTGFGNTIPEPWVENGNGVGGFSAGAFPCLTLPEGCDQEISVGRSRVPPAHNRVLFVSQRVDDLESRSSPGWPETRE